MQDDDPKDWEPVEEVEAPEKLRRKWIEREYFGPETVACPVCQKHVPAETVACLFCGAQMDYDSGPLGKMLRWFKGLFR
ncbi:MAG: hypothetical protein A2Y02_02490 [Omnitrophica bacterium GWA2_52_12]|nr:MAG: hypothetical protein A2Y02_02490 [Omnitrophica bacterium GWA2_52_12]